MKKIIFTLSLVISALVTQAQVGCFWHENFDAPSLNDSVFHYSADTASSNWALNSRLQISPDNCDSAAIINVNDTLILTTDSMDLTGMTYVLLEFDHICKVSFFDVAIIEVSFDGGANWFQMTDSEYLTDSLFPPGAPFGAQNNQFSAASYATWQPANDAAVPDNTWWKHEIFDISSWAGGFTEVQVRFVLYDSNIPGGAGNNGWKVENICITAAPCELAPPSLTQLPIIWQNTVYNLGPYTVNVDAADNSGIGSVWMYYTVSPVPGTLDSVQLTNISGNTFQGQIPAVADSDTVCYYFIASDASACANQTTSSTHCFVASSGIILPYCDNFDSQNLWVDSSFVAGTNWEWGTPAFGFTTGALSAPNAYDINLSSAYQPGADSRLLSPVFGPLIVNAKLEFWHKFSTQDFQDGTRIEYTTDGTTWTNLGDFANSCNCQVNWYTDAVINSSGQSAWAGNSGTSFPPPISNNGWVKSSYTFKNGFFNFGPLTQFRFVFTSNFSSGDGHSIDDICLTLPQPEDLGIASIIQPTGNAPAGNCVPVIVLLQNFGINTQTSCNIYYSYNGNTFGPFLWTGSLLTGDTTSVTLPCDTIVSGTLPLCAWTELLGDGNNANDTSCTTLVGVPTVVLNQISPYCENFANIATNVWFNQQNAGGGAGSDWQIGNPTYGTTNSTYSAPNCWDVNLTTIYAPDADVSLYTPYFDISTANNPYLSFYVNFNTEQSWDGVRLEYSINGQPWTLLNPATGTTNWYNMPTINCSGLPAWAGNSSLVLQNPTPAGWAHVEATDLTMLGAGNPSTFVQFRFVFCSDAVIEVDGFSIDDFCFAMPAPYDAGIPQIIQPDFSAPAGTCLPVIVTIKNFGSNTLDSLNVYYSMAGNLHGPYLWTGTLAPGQSINDTLPCDTIPQGVFTLCSWTELITQLDGNNFNDTSCNDIVGVPTITLVQLSPYCDNFDSGNIGWYNQNNGGAPGSDWELGTPAFGTTNSALSAPAAWDINLTTAYQNSADVALYTPYFDISNAIIPYLEFNVNFNTEQSWDGVRMEYSINGQPWTLLNPATGTTNWYNMPTINSSGLPAWAGNSSVVLQNPVLGGWCEVKAMDLPMLGAGNPGTYVQFRFVFTSDASVLVDGFSIDDFCFAMPAPFDAGVAQITQPGVAAPAGVCDTVIVTLHNFGTNTLTNFNVYYSVNSTVYGPFPWTGNLAPGQSTTDTLPCFTIPIGSFNICSWTDLIADGNHFNDTTCTNSVGVPVIPLSFTNNYCDDFEGPNAGWAVIFNPGANTASTWELGAPAYGTTTGAHSGTQAWDINLTTPYQINANVGLYTPIFDFGTGPANDVSLSFWRRHNTDQFGDGVRLEYTTNGTNWTLLGNIGSPNPPYVSWYNQNITANNLPAWSGNSIWVESKMTNLGLVGLNGNTSVQFRFIFASNGFTNLDGFSIDDFCLIVPVPLTATPTAIVNSTSSFPCIFEGQNVTFSATIKNGGTTPMTSVNAALIIDGSTVVTDPIIYSPALAPGASQVHAFTTIWVANTAGNHTVCAVTSDPNGLTDLNPTDDTICYTVQVCDTVGIASGSSYCNDFEGGAAWATFNAITYAAPTSWQLGTPAQTVLNAAHSGTKAWMTNLTANYPNMDTSGLFTPAFNIQGNVKYKLSFWHQYKSELYQDGGNVEYSTDYGATWNLLGVGGGGAPNFWYNSFFVTALGGIPYSPGWSGFLPAYQNAQQEICLGQSGPLTIMFRFRFMSDFTVNDEGWVIDDFCFEDVSLTCPVGIDEPTAANGLSLGQNYPNPTNGTTVIEYSIPENGNVQLSIINVMGQTVDVVVEQNESAGSHYVTFDTDRISQGIYYYELIFNNQKIVKKMVVTK